MLRNMNLLRIEKDNWLTDYIVHWKPLDMCNYDCSYCEPYNHRTIDVSTMPKVEDLIAVSDKIKAAVPEDKTVLVVLTGGEPFLIPNFELFLQRLVEHKFKIFIFTNGSMPAKMYERCSEALKSVNIFLSFHPETADIEKFVNLTVRLKENGGKVEVRAMLVPTLFNRVNVLEEQLKPHSIGINKLIVFPLVNTTTQHINMPFQTSRHLEDYTQKSDLTLDYFSEDEKAIIKSIEDERKNSAPTNNRKNFKINLTVEEDGIIKTTQASAYSIIMKDLNKFKGWSCNVGMKKLAIDANGDMHFGICKNDGKIGNVFNDEIVFNTIPTICRRSQCLTVDEIMVTKHVI